ncbi:hypothetical protein ACIQWA_32030 [Kitasatospora sp. NPDC098652]|uniref:hypothetical protein n=1 Tax=Kitasatospora sp. NPDC098652 TaxID=3364095 RepID=UPI00382CC629
MAVIAVVGGPGAPGATTTALALLLAWPLQPGRRILLVEADPDGGAVLAGALEGRVEAVYGLRNLAVADRRGLLAQTIWEQLIDLSPEGDAERLLLPGLTDPAQASGLAYTWEPLAELLHGIEHQGYDVIVDLGRSGATGAGAVLARRADVVAVTVRSTLRGLSAARPRLAALGEDLATAGTGADALGLLLVSEGPYSGSEVSREFGLPVLGELPHAPRTARVLSDGGDTTDRRFIRSELMRTARSAADEVQLLVRRRRQRLAPTAGPAAAPLPQGPLPPTPVPPTPVPPASVPPTPVPPAPAGPASSPYGPAGYGQQAYPDRTYQGQARPVHPPFPQPAHPQPVRPEPVHPEPAHPLPGYGRPGYGQTAPGTAPGEAEPPSYAPPVITTGPVAPLAGLAPQPAAPAPFPAHVQGAAAGPADEDDDPYQLQQPTVTDRRTGDRHPYDPGEVLRAR